MKSPRSLRFLAHGFSFIAGYISVALGHGHATVIIASGGLGLLIASALFFRADRLADRRTDNS
ncbi:hypothetical protein [Salinisphaera sp. LB1]|uniref:hypothetical protein n=1 Tax=Salinisphaera sp. LB1 TaxID=2183911 RepID=UPI000D7079E2|nr:hypothetical protein [Salinisphaera sp. LB1]AWN14261.1 hypothetical protein SALB1_0054 [Salinisphaera sp. LB1]